MAPGYTLFPYLKFDIPNSTCMQEVGDTPILEVILINRNMIVSEGVTLLTAVHDS